MYSFVRAWITAAAIAIPRRYDYCNEGIEIIEIIVTRAIILSIAIIVTGAIIPSLVIILIIVSLPFSLSLSLSPSLSLSLSLSVFLSLSLSTSTLLTLSTCSWQGQEFGLEDSQVPQAPGTSSHLRQAYHPVSRTVMRAYKHYNDDTR